MKKWIIYILLVCSITRVAAQDSYADKAAKYIDTYKGLAIAEQERSGVPAAVTLGQGILETEAGCSVLATGANNHFGIKCKSDWTGETFSHTDDAPDECFRKYSCAADSYKDHSDYLKNTPRYAALFRLQTTDYAGWAYGLKRCGYATNPKYATKLIGIIEDFHLEDYTEDAMGAAKNTSPYHQQDKMISHDATPSAEENKMIEPNAPQNAAGKIVIVNGLKAVYAYKGEQLLSFALKYHIRYARLLEMNDLPDAPLASSMYIYLEHKNIKGTHETHVVKPGEMLIQVAQAEGIQLRRLMTLNHMEWGEEPAAGAVLELQEFADKKPELITSVSNMRPVGAPKEAVIIRNGSNIKEVKNDEAVASPVTTATQPVSDYIDTKPIMKAEVSPTVSPMPRHILWGEQHTAPVKTDVSQTAQPASDYVDTKTQNTNTLVVSASETTSVAAPVTAEAPKPIQQSDYIDTKPAQTQAIDQSNNAEAAGVKEIPPVTEPVVKETPQEPTKADVVKDVNDTEGISPDVIPVAETKKEDVTEKPADAVQQPVEEEKEEVKQPKQDDDMITTEKTPVKKEVADTVAKAVAPKDEQPKDQLTMLKDQLDKVVYQDGSKPAVAVPQQNTEKKNDAAQANDDSKFYTVKDGDTAYSIAKDNNITVRQLMDWNDLDFNAIKTGDKLRVKE